MKRLQVGYEVSERRACGAMNVARSVVRYQSVADDQEALRIRLKDLAAVRVRYGYRRLHILLRREGWKVNAKRVYRLYCEENLTMRIKKPRRHVSSRNRMTPVPACSVNQRWRLSFWGFATSPTRRYVNNCSWFGAE